MNTKFTKGPWRVGYITKDCVFADESSDYVANCDTGELGHDDNIANAALIASAPELYAALVECLESEFAVTDKAAIANARAALKKARGEA